MAGNPYAMFGPCVRCGRYEHRSDCPSAPPERKLREGLTPLIDTTRDLPQLVRSAIAALDLYVMNEPKALREHLDLRTAKYISERLKGLLTLADDDAERAVRNCASIDTNGYICEKATVLAAMKSTRAMRGET